MKKLACLFRTPVILYKTVFIFLFGGSLIQNVNAQNVGVKTNLLYWATTTPNIGIEVAPASKWTIEVSGGYNPWTFSDNRKIKHWSIQPEGRYWLCESFNGHFFGVHAQVGEFNVAGMRILESIFGGNARDYRFQGNFVGGGISYGYQWILNTRWNLEATIGVGYNYVKYDKYHFGGDKCGIKQLSSSCGYLGPTKAGISFIYLIK